MGYKSQKRMSLLGEGSFHWHAKLSRAVVSLVDRYGCKTDLFEKGARASAFAQLSSVNEDSLVTKSGKPYQPNTFQLAFSHLVRYGVGVRGYRKLSVKTEEESLIELLAGGHAAVNAAYLDMIKFNAESQDHDVQLDSLTLPPPQQGYASLTELQRQATDSQKRKRRHDDDTAAVEKPNKLRKIQPLRVATAHLKGHVEYSREDKEAYDLSARNQNIAASMKNFSAKVSNIVASIHAESASLQWKIKPQLSTSEDADFVTTCAFGNTGNSDPATSAEEISARQYLAAIICTSVQQAIFEIDPPWDRVGERLHRQFDKEFCAGIGRQMQSMQLKIDKDKNQRRPVLEFVYRIAQLQMVDGISLDDIKPFATKISRDVMEILEPLLAHLESSAPIDKRLEGAALRRDMAKSIRGISGRFSQFIGRLEASLLSMELTRPSRGDLFDSDSMEAMADDLRTVDVDPQKPRTVAFTIFPGVKGYDDFPEAQGEIEPTVFARAQVALQPEE